MHKRFLIPSLALAAFCAEAIATPAAKQNASQAGSSSYSAGSKEDVSRLAGNMLGQVNQARAGIKKGSDSIALAHVKKAQNDLKQVEAKTNNATIVPVYHEFVSTSILTPVRTEQRANAHPQANQPAGNGGNQKKVVHEVAGNYSEMLVSTQVAKTNLDAALTDLKRGDLSDADKALARVQQGVKFRANKADMPLAKARQNLILARESARTGEYSETKAALQAASQALATYQQNGGPHSTDAANLKKQIDSYSQNVMQNHADAISTINQWWNTTMGWMGQQNPTSTASH